MKKYILVKPPDSRLNEILFSLSLYFYDLDRGRVSKNFLQ